VIYKSRKYIITLALLSAFILVTGCTTTSLTVNYDANSGSVLGVPENADEIQIGTKVTLTAVPNESYLFLGWNGVAGDKKMDNPLVLEVESKTSLEAVFGQNLYETSFEQGLESWVTANAEAEVVKGIARTGNNSAKIKITDGEGWNRFGLEMVDLLEKGEAYEISMWVYHEAVEPKEIHLVRKIGDSYAWISEDGNVLVPSGEWTEVVAYYDLAQEEEDITDELLIYVECNIKEVVYYVDDVTVKPLAF